MNPQNERSRTTKLAGLIKTEARGIKKKINIMEICGTHTMAISRFGLRSMLSGKINLISGPGCPVCVTPIKEIDRAIETAGLDNVIITTFGDMMRVPGTRSSLAAEKAKGKDIRIVYSPVDALDIAKKNPDKNVVFIGIGFETTAPSIAVTVKQAKAEKIKNFFVQAAFKTIIPPMEALLKDKGLNLHGFIAPGHVSAITGGKIYEYITRKYGVPCVISGFEALDILQTILMIIKQVKAGEGKVEIQYTRAVKYEGNLTAQAVLKEVFEEVGSNWRGIGGIPMSGLDFNGDYSEFSAKNKFRIDISYSKEPEGCMCGEVLKGAVKPDKCGLFAGACTPENPIGACMLSSEGTCAAYYKYER
jgi:hydrogenase expression/formation protein HypD